MVTVRGEKADDCLTAIAGALEKYEGKHPGAQVELYRQNSVSVRVRIVDAAFTGVSKAERHDTAWAFLQELPEEQQAEISLLLLLTPDEAKRSFANYEFDHPIPSRL